GRLKGIFQGQLVIRSGTFRIHTRWVDVFHRFLLKRCLAVALPWRVLCAVRHRAYRTCYRLLHFTQPTAHHSMTLPHPRTMQYATTARAPQTHNS
ncbi:hypothetical protein, partial [Xanthomonas vasicola]|uniref:hypothetical protein n=1 Tax=Xanthomonas vasicola TaxID=56459 RepID=UPI001C11CA19